MATAVCAAIGLYLFQPWRLWVDDVVHEPPPAGAGRPAADGQAGPAGPTVVAFGHFVSHEHTTTGLVRVLQTADGARVLRLEHLNTSNGPALHVWVTDAPVLRGRNGWFVFDDGRHRDLGALKGNIGSQNYQLPPGLDLARLTSVSIWCERFRVSFGAAELR